MGIVIPTNEEVLAYQGLHLYHSGISNCSMRVRMVLEEKKLDWESHHLNILKKEHITSEYFGINPNGLVPTLVHDGVVIIESDDIIEYVDNLAPFNPLTPECEEGLAQMHYWLRKAVEIHMKAVKIYIYDRRVGKTMAHDSIENEKYRSLQTNPELLEFHRRSTSTGFSREEVLKAEAILKDCFKSLEQVLTKSDWIVGNSLSLADIAWIPLHFTLSRLAGFSFESYKNISQWSERISQRPSFQRGVLDWWPAAMEGK